jgi:molybdopterin synthase catalytic subunit
VQFFFYSSIPNRQVSFPLWFSVCDARIVNTVGRYNTSVGMNVNGDPESTESRDSDRDRVEDGKAVKNLKVLFFARAREIAGVSETILKMEGSSTTVSDCVDAITRMFPALQEISSCSIVALNQTYVDDVVTTLINDRDELALIPPISGG